MGPMHIDLPALPPSKQANANESFPIWERGSVGGKGGDVVVVVVVGVHTLNSIAPPLDIVPVVCTAAAAQITTSTPPQHFSRSSAAPATPPCPSYLSPPPSPSP